VSNLQMYSAECGSVVIAQLSRPKVAHGFLAFSIVRTSSFRSGCALLQSTSMPDINATKF
jgi:hypothetical protein